MIGFPAVYDESVRFLFFFFFFPLATYEAIDFFPPPPAAQLSHCQWDIEQGYPFKGAAGNGYCNFELLSLPFFSFVGVNRSVMDPWAVMMMNEPFLQICDPISIRLDLLFHPLSLFYLFLFSNCSPWEARTGQPIWDQAGLRTG